MIFSPCLTQQVSLLFLDLIILIPCGECWYVGLHINSLTGNGTLDHLMRTHLY